MTIKITSGEEWTFDKIDDVYLEIEKIALEKYGLNVYPNQIEIISSEQMLDAYSSVGLPIYYPHWSFGESFIKQMESYQHGHMGLAYEIVINSSPAISYCMEENTMGMQALVIAHAAFGHNHFFANNYLFKQWTDAEGIVDYLLFAKKYITKCEEQYGIEEVELVLDAAHSLQNYGVDKYKRPSRLSAKEEKRLQEERDKYNQSQINEIWNSIPTKKECKDCDDEETFPVEPQENILYFIEKNAPKLENWKREIIRIVRKIAQYFYPQSQTKVMNEGFATYTHYNIMKDLYDKGILDESAMLEFFHSHTAVVFQPDFNDKRFSGINPYALGFAMMQDIERVANNPTEEDYEWFKGQDWVGGGDHMKEILHAVENFKDESFIQQYLSPKLIRDFKLFAIHDDENEENLLVSGIHNQQGYKTIRETLSKQHSLFNMVPNIQVYDVDRWDTRTLTLQHSTVDGRPLNENLACQTLEYLAYLWEYGVELETLDEEGEIEILYEFKKYDEKVEITYF